MKIVLKGLNVIHGPMDVSLESLDECSVILYDGQHYMFQGYTGVFHTVATFVAIKAPLVLIALPTPAPERKFLGLQEVERDSK